MTEPWTIPESVQRWSNDALLANFKEHGGASIPLEVVMHPDDVTAHVREVIARTENVVLRESTVVNRGCAYIVKPGLLRA